MQAANGQEKETPTKSLLEVELENIAKEATGSCKHCNGKGHEGYSAKKDAYILCRCVRRNRRRRAAKAAEASGEPSPGMIGEFNSVQVGTIRRMRDEIALLLKKSEDLEKEYSDHPMQGKLEKARKAVEEEQREITAKVNTSKELRSRATREEQAHDRCLEEAEALKRRSRQHRERQVQLTREAEALESSAAKAEARSRSEGVQADLRRTQKRHHQQTHRLRKKGREAALKAEKLKAKLEATYPGHEVVP